MWKQRMTEWAVRLTPYLQKYRYVCLVLLAGVLILALGAPRDAPEDAAPAADSGETQAAFDFAAFEARLQQKLSLIEGAGQVELMLSMEDTEETIYASDTRQSASGEQSTSYENSLSILSDGSYGEQPVRVKSVCPTFRGAVILCEGGDDPAVRWSITEAVSAACGLRTDKITVLKMQS